MSASHGQPADDFVLLDEFHSRTHSLALWASKAAEMIVPKPDWEAVRRWFSEYGEHRKWVIEHWHILKLFELPRIEAVVWAKQGWRNWHATVVESLVHNGYYMRLILWLGTPEDREGQYVAWPDQLDWLRDDLGLPADVPNLDRSRVTAWRRLLLYTGRKVEGALPSDLNAHVFQGSGWAYLDHFDLWTHVPHLRAELAATRRLLGPHVTTPSRGSATPPPGDGPGPQRRFNWRGKSADFSRAPYRFALCQALWDGPKARPKAESRLADVRAAVYPDEQGTDSKFKDLVKNVREAFEGEGMAITITIASELIWLDPLPE